MFRPETGADRHPSFMLRPSRVKLMTSATNAAQNQNRVALAGLSGDEQHLLIDLMQRVIAAMLRD